ncbi:MAG: EFR1 family ferrodoxin [Oscillospiraceae bacterium]
MINKLYFSPTGSTKNVVELIAGVWEGEQQEVDFSILEKDYSACTFAPDDICLIGVPSFGGRVPTIAAQHLEKMKAASTPTILVVTYGNRDYDDTLLELKNIVKQSGFNVIAAIAAVTEHSIMHQFGTGRPDALDRKELLEFAQKIKEETKNPATFSDVVVKGNMPYKEYLGLPFKPSANKNCNNCGACAKSCPVGAIPAKTPSQTLNDRCITCMRCVSICAQHARNINPALLFVAGKKMQKACGGRKLNYCFFGEKR